MANKEFKHKLSEAVERMSYDVLPEAKPEDFEINVVAAVSEPFADARARNKAAKERFKKMIDVKTEQAKKDLGLDNQLKERQANGNGKLVEVLTGEEGEAVKLIKDIFEESHYTVSGYVQKNLAARLREDGVYSDSAFSGIPDLIDSSLKTLYENIQDKYIKNYTAMKEGKDNVKISLDESLFTPVDEKADEEDIKEKLAEKLSSEQAEVLEKVLRDTRDNLDRYLWQLDTDVAEKISQLKDDEREKLLVEIEKLIKTFYDKKLTESKESTEKLTEAKIIHDAREYKPWQGAVDTYEKIQEANKLDSFFNLLDEAYPSGIDEQALNDLLWFDADWIYEMLGMEVEE